jgi:hypothetical protein
MSGVRKCQERYETNAAANSPLVRSRDANVERYLFSSVVARVRCDICQDIYPNHRDLCFVKRIHTAIIAVLSMLYTNRPKIVPRGEHSVMRIR